MIFTLPVTPTTFNMKEANRMIIPYFNIMKEKMRDMKI